MNPRVTGAFVIGIALVFGAYTLATFGVASSRDTAPRAAVGPVVGLADTPQRQYIATADSNNDGVPDWQEMLNQTEPLTFTPGEEYIAPETLTDRFALEFFEGYVRNEGFGDFAEDPELLIDEASQRLASEVQDRLYFEDDITIVSSNPMLLRVHANAVATIIEESVLPVGTPNELDLVERVIATNNEALLTQLDPIIANYDAMISKMLATPVPNQMVKEHLDLVNAYQAVHNDIAAMKLIFDDPLFALMRLQRYEDDIRGMLAGITNLFNQTRNLGAPLQASDPVFRVYSFE